MSELLHFSEHRLQEVALAAMACVYAVRISWLLRFKAGRERQAPTGSLGSSKRQGILYSWLNIGMPWAMESTRTKVALYGQFVVFHLGVVAAIALSFIVPYAPEWLESQAFVLALQWTIGAAFLVGLARIYRRVANRTMRAISSPDDYFSLALLTTWFLFAFLAAPNRPEQGETAILTYFLLTAFFLIYVPFSKISHYLYYPFTRYYLGKTLGYRGVFPLRRGSRPAVLAGSILHPAAPNIRRLAAEGPPDDLRRQ
jgi:nitrate reductase gamma subunit